MFLKQIDLYGFKSFSAKTTLKFGEGITAIVGPNGTGKSNIQESIKWVLGEQNPRELRGKEMQDVIFNGTQEVPPLGFAEVFLTFDNSAKIFPLAYEEVVITRRLYRSGESEYLINKNPVRLKDIEELIAGTGIGTSAYSIMEQGKIDQVLAAKPEERREIFEEASGITKYKVKEKEAMRKLDSTEENLTRIRDILLEVKRQVSFIERQVSKAQKYQNLYEQLKKLEIGLGALDYRGFIVRKAHAEEARSKSESSLHELTEQVKALANQAAQLRQELGDRRQVLEEKEKEWAQLEANFKLSQDRVQMERRTQEEWENQRERLLREIAVEAERITQLTEQIRQTQEEQHSCGQEREKKSEKIRLMEAEIRDLVGSIRQGQEKRSQLQAGLADLMKRQTDLKNELLQVTHQQRHVTQVRDRLVKERQTLMDQLAQWDQQRAMLRQSQQEIQNQLDRLKQIESESLAKLHQLRSTQEEAALTCHQKENQQSALLTKIQFLEDLRARYEGFSEGVRYLLAGEQPQPEGVFDCIANLIEVEPGYEMAAEAALGEHLQTILVDRAYTALKAMGSVISSGKGKVALLPLEWIPVNHGLESPQAKKQESRKPLTDVVHCSEQYRSAIEFLLRDVFIVDSLDSGALSGEELSNARFATLDGKIAGKGLVGGGTHKGGAHQTALLGRERRLRELKSEEQETEQKIAELKNQLAQMEKEMNDLEAVQSDSAKKIQQLEKQMTHQQLGCEELDRRAEEVAGQQELLEKELDQLETERHSLEEKEGEWNLLIHQREADQQRERQTLEELQQEILSKEQERENRQLSLTEIKTELSALTREAEKRKQTLEFLNESLANERASHEGRQASIQEIEERISQSRKAVEELQRQAQEWGAKREGFQGDLTALQQEQSRLEGELQSAETHQRNLQDQRQQIQETMNLAAMEIKEMEVKMEHLLLRLRDAYQVESEGLEGVTLECAAEEAQEQLQQLRKKVGQLGPVNVAALEEHQELTQRLEFLTNQEQDLVQARESLVSAIQKIRRTTRTLFRETFEQIQVHFQEFFTKLFEGGDAKLILIDQEEVLESGIEIMVRPSGKKLQNISLLSGGERALTATALLFALFKTKPSPFCILDELDAPLDEANIDRFCDTLKELTQQSQFLLITHNKKTMTIADALYGVTMERPGISQIISVRMTRSAEPAESQEPPSGFDLLTRNRSPAALI